MNILFASSEAVPFIKSGGLGDVAGALPISLRAKKTDTRVILPLYSDISDLYKNSMTFLGSREVPLAWRQQYAGLYSLILNNVTFYFVDNEYYFKRKGLYGYYDDGERFAFFSKAVLELLPLMDDFVPDVLHVNDWQTALIPLYLDIYYRGIDRYKKIRTVLTIHNIEFQGEMDKYCIGDVFGIPSDFAQFAEYKGNANMLKAGIEAANKVVTVSPTYATEIFYPYFSYGLDSILNLRNYKISGILNGIDTVSYDPMKDKSLFKNYSAKSLSKKRGNKVGLQALLGLPEVDKPVIGMITRLTQQKGIDLVLGVINELLSKDIQIIILGTGDWRYEAILKEKAQNYPTKLQTVISFSQDLAAKIYAGSDMFLMPSKFEPCGLSQMIAMRYGTIPIVRETGGLKDSVEPFDEESGNGVGFTFKSYNAYDMLDAVNRALDCYNDDEKWKKVVANAMSRDFSWNSSAKNYIDLYKSII